MINLDYAYLIARGFIPGTRIIKCYDYDSLYVFETIPKAYNQNNTGDILLDSLVAVDKKTGRPRAFKPFDISPEEYRKGRQVKLPAKSR